MELRVLSKIGRRTHFSKELGTALPVASPGERICKYIRPSQEPLQSSERAAWTPWINEYFLLRAFFTILSCL